MSLYPVKIPTARTLWRSPMLALLACSALGGAAAVAQAPKAADDLVLTHGTIYTGEAKQPWAQAVVVRGGKLAYVGNAAGARRAAPKGRVVDLHGAFVMAGMIDAHTHPGMVSTLGTGDEARDMAEGLPGSSKEELFAALRAYAKAHPDAQMVSLSGWNPGNFGIAGPNKRDLDAIWPTTPVILADNTGHSFWANSAMLKILGVQHDTPDLTPGVSVLMRDASGEPTGWLKEFVVMPTLAPLWWHGEASFRSRMKSYLSFLAEHGVTSVWDAGNYGLEDKVYAALAAMDKAGEVPVRYFGSYHIWDPRQFDIAIARMRHFQSAYGSKNLIFNTVKIHYDGISEISTSGQDAPFATDPHNRGGMIADSHRLAKFLIDLDKAGINIHLHTIGDRASNEALDAVEQARHTLGRPLRITVTLCHLETLRPENVKRFKALGVTANFTPFWFGGIEGNTLSVTNLGSPRINHTYQMGTLVRSGANVATGSDIISSFGISMTAPLAGLQMATTRKMPDKGAGPEGSEQPEERITLPQAIRATTLGGANQLHWGDQAGTLRAGKRADLVVLDHNPFKVGLGDIHAIRVTATIKDGKLTAGHLGD